MIHVPFPNLACCAVWLHWNHLSRVRIAAIGAADHPEDGWNREALHLYQSILGREMQRRGMSLMMPLAYTVDGQRNESAYGPLPPLAEITIPIWHESVHAEHRELLRRLEPLWYTDEWRNWL